MELVQISMHREDQNHDAFPSGKPPKSSIRYCNSSLNLPQSEEDCNAGTGSEFQPVFRSGFHADKGPKRYMEDEFVCVDDLRSLVEMPSDGAFYGVFDGHGGNQAALETKENMLGYIVEDSEFLTKTKKALRRAFAKADNALADSKTVDGSSGTTALVALVLGRRMLVANAGDSRAVLGRRGRAIELSKDHKPNCASERARIERLGGEIHDGYLNGQIGVARALGDWEIKGSKGNKSPLIAEPDLEEVTLSEEDEFLILGCDGVWDVMSSQCAVTMARKELMVHNDPSSCSRALAKEALHRNTCDNVTIVVICFSSLPPPKISLPPSHKRRSISAEGLDRLKGLLHCE